MLLAKLCARLRANGERRPARGVGPKCSRGTSAVHEMESAMKRLFMVVVIFGFAALGPANAQRSNPANATPGVPLSPTVTPGAATSGGQRAANPAFAPQGPCSVSPNVTGGVTTSSSCGTDPLEVPTRTLSASSQASGGATPSPQSSGGSSSAGGTATSSAGTTGSSTSQSASPVSSTGSAGGASVGTAAPCSSVVPTTNGSSPVGGLAGGC